MSVCATIARRFRADRFGTAAVEFAIVAPVFILLLAGIMMFGLYFGLQIAVTEAAAEGARLSVAGLSATERVSLANQGASGVLNSYAPILSAASATITAAPASANAALFTVTVSYPFTNFFPALVPINTSPTATVTVSDGGY